MALVGERIEQFHLAVLHIDKAIGAFARPNQKGAGLIVRLGPERTHRRHMVGRQRLALHFRQIAADRFHGHSSDQTALLGQSRDSIATLVWLHLLHPAPKPFRLLAAGTFGAIGPASSF